LTVGGAAGAEGPPAGEQAARSRISNRSGRQRREDLVIRRP
jgi:hypothetical protein